MAVEDRDGIGQSQSLHSPRRRRRIYLVIVAVAIATISISFVLTAIGGWAPILHWSCSSEGEPLQLTQEYVPAVLVNSPYGGRAWGNGTLPANYPGVWNGPPPVGVTKVAFGTGAVEGEALGAFFAVNVSIERLQNATEWGSGANIRCSQSVLVTIAPPVVTTEAGGGLLGLNNTTDSSEPSYAWIFQGTSDQLPSAYFDNAFAESNSPLISTCGSGSKSLNMTLSSYLDVQFRVDLAGLISTVPFVIPVSESYQYWFPSGFGEWQVDNLSAPGGPGGGWAFSYSSCS